jgi:hypothetical protein
MEGKLMAKISDLLGGAGSGLNADLWQGYTLTNAPVGIGVGQTWQDVSASRDAGTTYTNDTGKPIALSLQSYGDDSNGSDLKIVVDGVDVARSAVNDGNSVDYCSGFAIIPNGSTYSGNTVNRGGTLVWLELR